MSSLVRSGTGQPLEGPAGLTLLSRGVVDERGRQVSDGELSHRLRTGHGLDKLGAPYGAMFVDADEAVVAADHVGFRHLYGTQQKGWAATATSARELARLTGATLDREALGVQRIVGHHLNEDTAYSGITKLASAHYWRLGEGRLTSIAYPELDRVTDADLVEAHAARLRELVTGFLDSHDEVVLELSGGMDSRLVLAAVPPKRRKELTGFTIVHSTSAEGKVARELAGRYGMRHIETDLDGMSHWTPEETYQRVLATAIAQDAMGAPLSSALYTWAEEPVAEYPRLSGHGGELVRAGFYQFQPDRPTATAKLADRFFQLWFAHNYGVPDDVLSPDFAAESREIGYRKVRETLAAYDTDWMTAMGLYFVRERLHRWGGITISAGVHRRITLNPLLDLEVLKIMFSVPHRRKWSSHQAVDVMAKLDPELASLPLSSGLKPTTLQRSPKVTWLLGEASVTMSARLALNKVMRHLRRSGNPAVGTPVVSGLVVRHWQANPSILEPVRRLGLINESWLDRMLAGQVPATPAAVDYLVNLTVLAEG